MSLLTLLVLMMLSLATLVRVEVLTVQLKQYEDEARQNALLGMQIALGELQKLTGPDRRATATADVVLPESVSITPQMSGQTTATALSQFWNAGRNSHWVGVWKKADTGPYDPNEPSAHMAEPQFINWLVSGNEQAPESYKPITQIIDLHPTSRVTETLHDEQGAEHVILVQSSANADTPETLGQAVTAPLVSIEEVDGVYGRYAWWVGDEGVKARADLRDPYSDSGLDDISKLYRRASAQRISIEAIAEEEALGLYPANNESLELIDSEGALDLIVNSPQWPDALDDYFHDITIHSKGVLADAKNGGLKNDLSYILSQDSVGDFRTALDGAFEDTDPAPSSLYNTALSAESTVYATLPDAASADFPYDGAEGILSRSATWEQLWSYYNMSNFNSDSPAGVYQSIGGERVAMPRLHTPTQHGLYPLLTHAKLFFRMRIVGGTPDADGVNRSGTIWVDSMPLVVLANPYNVALGPSDYTLRLSASNPVVRFGDTDVGVENYQSDGIGYDSKTGINKHPGNNLDNGYLGDILLTVRSAGFEPGEARIFTIDPSSSLNPTIDGQQRIEILSRTDSRAVVMTNEFDPTPALTYNTGASIPQGKNFAALYTGSSRLSGELYLDYPGSPDDRYLVQWIIAQSLSDSFNEDTANFFLVDPMSSNIRQGGGYMFAVYDAPNASTVTQPNDRRSQQAAFYQANYRSLTNQYAGKSSISHLSERARTYGKSGSTGSMGSAPNPYFEAHIMRPLGGTQTTRWGLSNLGTGAYQNEPQSYLAEDAGFANLMYDLPRPELPLSSLGQLQHFNTTGFLASQNSFFGQPERSASVVNHWQVNYAISNSYAHPRVTRDQVFYYDEGKGYHYDGSYLWNDVLWDRFFVSTYPEFGSIDFETETLPNARLKPIRQSSDSSRNDPENYRGDGDVSSPANSRIAASNLLVEGAFNVNSTSVDAWVAILSSLRNVPLGGETDEAQLTAPFARTLYQTGGASEAKSASSANAWSGVRNLTDEEVRDLSEEIVRQVQLRGPFLSLSDFVNRKLIASTADEYDLGLSGTLQTAIDRVLNQADDLPPELQVTTRNKLKDNQFADEEYIMPTGASGFPGYLLQADILSVLGPLLLSRSDTFIIRSYGDAVNPLTNQVEAQAWSEAVVQRIPSYIVDKDHGGDAAYEKPLLPENMRLGRRYVVIDFRWLDPSEI
ncbi:hypothetical protein GCM10007047_25000 [Cerasicoccus arenae]|uniref:Uncharacterized protein n=2 Tax=Cerasicoccus arenae TaxID=424488 RepID=A0A8J3DJ56_9BACT|nr:hypothetical protein GCM10007047_25000 [Cerasicoccus arenae]